MFPVLIITCITSSAAMVLHFEPSKNAVRYSGKCVRRAAHAVWINWMEYGCIMAGRPCEFDSSETGDNYAPSPMIHE